MIDTKKIRPGDIILFKGKSFISRSIRWFTKSKWNHVGFATCGTFIIEATEAGVEKNELAPLIKKSSAICILRIPNLKVSEVEAMKDKAYSLIYKEYDFIQLFSLGIYYTFRKLGIHWSWLIRNSRSKIICSELIAICAMTIPVIISKKPKTVTPETLYKSIKLNKILEVSL